MSADMFAALVAMAKEQTRDGSSVQIHAMGCRVTVGEDCDCEPLTVMATKAQA